MTTQPEALRLADLIDNGLKNAAHHDETAAELRRLHAVNQELLEACKAYDEWADKTHCYDRVLRGIRHKMRTAIARAEGQA